MHRTLSACLPCSRRRSRSAAVEQGETEEGSSSGGEEEEGDPHTRTAWEVGLNGAALTEEEQGLLPAGADEATYVRVRAALFQVYGVVVGRAAHCVCVCAAAWWRPGGTSAAVRVEGGRQGVLRSASSLVLAGDAWRGRRRH